MTNNPATQSVEAPIEDVTVYVNHARVTRRGKVELEKGEHTLILSPITHKIDTDSVRASGHGAGVTIRSVEVIQEYGVHISNDKADNLKAQWLDHWNEHLMLEDETKTLQSKIDLLEKLGTESSAKFAENVTKDELSFDNMTQMMRYVVEQIESSRSQLREINKRDYELTEKVAVIKQRLNQLDSDRMQQHYQIQVKVEAEQATQFEFEVSYNVNQAMWEPVYDVRLDKDDEVSLSFMATIEQRTGEEWWNINLSLSTARSSLTTTLSTLQKWKISTEDPRRIKESMELTSRVSSSPSAPVAKIAQATVRKSAIQSINTTATTYDIAGSVTIPHDGTPHQVAIIIEKLGVSLDYFTVPRASKDCHLRAKIINTSEFTLLPGTVSIFHEGNFVGRTTIDLVAPKESFYVHLGVDDRIRVEHKIIKHEYIKGFLGTKQKVERRYRITLSNYLDKSAKLIVKDHYPHSESSALQIKLDEAMPEPEEETPLNELTWVVEIPPDEKQVIEYEFTVEGNGTKPIYGL